MDQFAAGYVLNHIGRAIDPKGLMRIKSYVGKVAAASKLP